MLTKEFFSSSAQPRGILVSYCYNFNIKEYKRNYAFSIECFISLFFSAFHHHSSAYQVKIFKCFVTENSLNIDCVWKLGNYLGGHYSKHLVLYDQQWNNLGFRGSGSVLLTGWFCLWCWAVLMLEIWQQQ